MRSRTLAVSGILLAAALTAGCDTQANNQRLARLAALSAEKDSLLAVVAENTRLMSDISSTLARVRGAPRAVTAVVSPETPVTSSPGSRDSLRVAVAGVVDRLNQAEARLAAAQRRIRAMGAGSDSLKAQLALMEQSVTDLQAALANQRVTIEQMTAQLNDVKAQNLELTARAVALADTLARVDTDRNTVYYVVGTKDELKRRGVLVEEGSKFLFFGSRTLAPARDLSPRAFTAIDQRSVNQIPLPRDGTYRIVSRQNMAALGTPAKDGKVRGPNLKIAEPGRFWAPSRYLIIVEG